VLLVVGLSTSILCIWRELGLQTLAMAMYEGETTRIVDKFNGDNFSLFKFKMEMILDEKEMWTLWRAMKRLL
jgi:hypothetical protein